MKPSNCVVCDADRLDWFDKQSMYFLFSYFFKISIPLMYSTYLLILNIPKKPPRLTSPISEKWEENDRLVSQGFVSGTYVNLIPTPRSMFPVSFLTQETWPWTWMNLWFHGCIKTKYHLESTNLNWIWWKQFRDWIAAFIRSKRDIFEVRLCLSIMVIWVVDCRVFKGAKGKLFHFVN